MTKHAETFDHTADVGIAATADTLEELLEALAEGMADYICPRSAVRADESRLIVVQAQDVEALAVDFLTEVLVVMETDRFLPARVVVQQASEQHVAAELVGEPFDPARHEYVHEVKAVTYHKLEIRESAGQWTARVIVDI